MTKNEFQDLIGKQVNVSHRNESKGSFIIDEIRTTPVPGKKPIYNLFNTWNDGKQYIPYMNMNRIMLRDLQTEGIHITNTGIKYELENGRSISTN